MIISINDFKPYVIGLIKLEIPSMKKILNILEIIAIYILAIMSFIKKDYFNALILIILGDIETRLYGLERNISK